MLSFPKQLYLNGFRKTLEEYITEERGAAQRRARTYRKRTDTSGHSWRWENNFELLKTSIYSDHRVLQPNHCAVCEKSLWQLTQKHMICSICKALIHKKCGEDPDHPSYPKCKPVSNENQLFGVHLERLCREGNWCWNFYVANLLFRWKHSRLHYQNTPPLGALWHDEGGHLSRTRSKTWSRSTQVKTGYGSTLYKYRFRWIQCQRSSGRFQRLSPKTSSAPSALWCKATS